MEQKVDTSGPVMRLFEAQAKPGRADELMEKFAKVSVEVVRDEPGNQGYFFGRRVDDEVEVVVFASIWKDMKSVKDRFGSDWGISYLPEGYEDLIDDCWVRHYDFGAGWNLRPEE